MNILIEKQELLQELYNDLSELDGEDDKYWGYLMSSVVACEQDIARLKEKLKYLN